jgi:hypothetical protein
LQWWIGYLKGNLIITLKEATLTDLMFHSRMKIWITQMITGIKEVIFLEIKVLIKHLETNSLIKRI